MTIAQKTSGEFILKAKGPGKVVDINRKDKLVKVDYKDGTSDVFKFGDTVGLASGSYYNHCIELTDDIKVGKSVKEGTILGYHSGFFSFDPVIKEPIWNHGVSSNVAIVSKGVVLEDSCAISSELAGKLNFQTVYDRTIRITTDMVVKDSVKIGDKVDYNSLLLKLEYESTAALPDEVDELFEDLQFVEYRAKNVGVVVDIQIYHVSDDMTESMKKYVQTISKGKRRIARYSKNTKQAGKFTPVTKVDIDTRIHGITMNELDVLVIFFIRSDIGMVAADKLVVGNQLRSVVGSVEMEPMYTESGLPVDVLFGANGVFNRVVLGAFKIGICNRILMKAEEEILAMYF